MDIYALTGDLRTREEKLTYLHSIHSQRHWYINTVKHRLTCTYGLAETHARGHTQAHAHMLTSTPEHALVCQS